VYSEELSFGVSRVGFPRHWKQELRLLQQESSLLHQRSDALAQAKPAESKPPSEISPEPGTGDSWPPPAPPVTLLPAGSARPGHDFMVTVKGGPGIARIRLRYRHLTQFEDYRSLEMSRDPASELYSATIPGAFLDPKWDLMYFAESYDSSGNGRNYPDLDVETPYVVVPVQR
jgi:hypothetical protein